jgi:hypothetical protein
MKKSETENKSQCFILVYIVTCYATEDAVLIGKSFYFTILQVVISITFYTVTHLHSLQSAHS